MHTALHNACPLLSTVQTRKRAGITEVYWDFSHIFRPSVAFAAQNPTPPEKGANVKTLNQSDLHCKHFQAHKTTNTRQKCNKMHRHALNSMTSPNAHHPLDPNTNMASRKPAQHKHIHYFKRRRVLQRPHHRKSLYNKYILYIYFSQKKPPKNEDESRTKCQRTKCQRTKCQGTKCQRTKCQKMKNRTKCQKAKNRTICHKTKLQITRSAFPNPYPWPHPNRS